jgi:hypothetical protein
MKRIRDLSLAPMVLALLGTPHALAAENEGMQRHVAFASGGIGAASQEDLRARERDFNLKLVFTLVEGDYVANVNVVIRDGGGRTVLQHEAPGPLFMARLPSGNYQVTTTYEGQTHSRWVSVGQHLRTEQFRWPSNPQTDSPVPRDSRG